MTWPVWWTTLVISLIAWMWLCLYLAPLLGRRWAERARRKWRERHGE